MRLTLKAKLAASFGLVLTVMEAAGVDALISLHASNDRMRDFARRPVVQVQRSQQMEMLAIDAARAFVSDDWTDQGDDDATGARFKRVC